MAEKRDSLGRRYPKLDRSAIAKKGEATKKEKYGNDFHSRIGATGGSRRKRGYFGTLKDQGKTAELAAISKEGGKKSHRGRAKGSETKRKSGGLRKDGK